MTLPTLTLRPAVDTRPPAEPWSGVSAWRDIDAQNQPPLRLIEDVEPEPLLAGAPKPARLPVTVDLEPAGVPPEHQAELVDQARTWAPWFAQLLVESIDGRRPLESLGHWLDEWVLAEVTRLVRVRRRLRTRSPATPPPAPAAVASLRSQLVDPRVLEVAAHLRRDRRSSALAFRLVRRGERWLCTALRAG